MKENSRRQRSIVAAVMGVQGSDIDHAPCYDAPKSARGLTWGVAIWSATARPARRPTHEVISLGFICRQGALQTSVITGRIHFMRCIPYLQQPFATATGVPASAGGGEGDEWSGGDTERRRRVLAALADASSMDESGCDARVHSRMITHFVRMGS